MPSSRTSKAPHHGLSWLLWLALLLPMAQFAALRHTLAHATQEAGVDTAVKKSAHTPHCDLCLSASAVTGGALKSATQVLFSSVADHVRPLHEPRSAGPAERFTAYHSRAPPLAPR